MPAYSNLYQPIPGGIWSRQGVIWPWEGFFLSQECVRWSLEGVTWSWEGFRLSWEGVTWSREGVT